ncbi:hypothetical protein M5K25_018765 [Dendrobium thyrsiflorum]|uniref:Uncharacterized protein n=1 Tax=Dendrobium thyrsiflorum TaxID=117978 RepID=A0ABD0UK10_DENTH
MDVGAFLHSFLPSWSSAGILLSYLVYLALAGAILPGKNVPGAVLSDGTRLHYRCNGLASLFILMALLGIGVSVRLISPTVIADRGPELFSVTFIFSVIVTLLLYITGCKSHDSSSSLKARVTGNFIHDWWFGVQLNPHFMGIDLKFATSYLTLQSILDVRQPLEAMFTSTQWLNSAWGKKPEGKEIRRHILNDKFWASVTYAILSTRPLVQVLRLVDAEKKPAMGFIYNAMDEAKELIAHNLGGEEASYREIWDIIDVRWEVQLHRHLHAAAYYLNPQFQYSERKSSNPEVKLGLYHCMERLIPDLTVREIADLQLVLFRNREGFFGLHAAKSTIAKRSPDSFLSERV